MPLVGLLAPSPSPPPPEPPAPVVVVLVDPPPVEESELDDAPEVPPAEFEPLVPVPLDVAPSEPLPSELDALPPPVPELEAPESPLFEPSPAEQPRATTSHITANGKTFHETVTAALYASRVPVPGRLGMGENPGPPGHGRVGTVPPRLIPASPPLRVAVTPMLHSEMGRLVLAFHSPCDARRIESTLRPT